MEKRVLLRCISLGLVRCGSIGFDCSLLLCLCSALVDEVFPLRALIPMALETPNGDFEAAKEHLESVLFNEAGAVTGAFCNQYAMADDEHKLIAENCIWDYSKGIYLDLRKAVILLRGKGDELIGNLDKIAEAAFLMVVVFAAEVSKQKLNSKLSEQFRPEVAVKILVAFSCIEYLRRVRLPEYTEAVRRAVLTIQENAAFCSLFVESLPPYAELTNQRGSLALEGMRYVWWEDEVQTARVLFWMRVIPTCISLVPASVFGKLVAPTMFLYMHHPNEKVARSSHSVFVAFVSSGKDCEQDDRLALKEKLVFYYVQRSLEAYPGITPFEGLASGVAALVRHLPAGSPAIFFCIHSLVEKATDLCSKALNQDSNLWKRWEGNTEPCKKVLDLLLRLIALVDIQVLPYLLKQLAEFVVQLPKEGQNVLLDEMHAQVAESDDVTRKPVLVSWLQSLSYLCSQKKPTSLRKGDEAKSHDFDGTLQLNQTSSRL
ncbi:uncharacterized protein A4U43_UnF9740 [Asparagus officinalis]|uniref:Uncharacterized protein n=2 Tax=Asparagus officinalis TaxID=4686 RepID=A0A1R3L5N4_ASPOF|nr:uncharacterized protein A4U43_UnF9740 [Asparagus officinalis]